MLEGTLPTGAAPGRLVLDLPDGFEHSPGAVERATALVALGASLALHRYTGTPEQDALLPTVDFVVVDAPADGCEPGGARRPCALRPCPRPRDGRPRPGHRRPLRRRRCRRPARRRPSERASDETAPPKILRPGQLQCLAALHLLHQEDVTMARVAAVIDTDPVLTLRVLHLVNSGAFALRSRVDTVRQGVVLLGVREVTTLVTALALDARPGAMDSLWHILARALSSEALCGDPAAYTAGMLSALIDELGVPAEVVLDAVGVSPVVADAILELTGDVGLALAAVLAHERRDAATRRGLRLRAGRRLRRLPALPVRGAGDRAGRQPGLSTPWRATQGPASVGP